MSSENFPERLRAEADKSREVNTLNATFGNHPVLPHLAVVSTALAIAGYEIGIGKKGKLAPRNEGKSLSDLLSGKASKKDSRHFGVSGISRPEAPHVFAKIDTGSRSAGYVTALPYELSNALLNPSRTIASTRLELQVPSSDFWVPKLSVGIDATHHPYSEKQLKIEKFAKTPDASAFDDLFALIFDEEEVEDPLYGWGDQKTKTTQLVLTNNPERHFDMHEAMGVSDEQMAKARRTFHAVASVCELPYIVATE